MAIAETKSENLKVVIVDDSPLIVTRLQQMLQPIDRIEISGTAGNINQAFGLVREFEPDVVILDIYLEHDAPAANGLTLLAVLSQGFPKMKVIMLTNLSGAQYRNRCMSMGAKYFLDKSNEFERVPDILMQIIDLKNNVNSWPG